MKQFVFCLLICSSFFCFSQGATKTEINWIKLEKAKQYAKKYNKEILIFFYKKDCEYCDKMKKET
jgi:thioredoxin-related protein